jgi:hypothetical protein
MELINRKIFFLVKEYEKLKDEQNKRIEFRDHMTYITLGVIGGVFSFIVERPDYITALLVLPFVCIILGWSYLTNDDKISEIGSYCQNILIPKIEESNIDASISLKTNWEEIHKISFKRNYKTNIQLLIDILLFCVPAFLSLIVFFQLSKETTVFQIIVASFEALFVVFLACFFVIFKRHNTKK